MDTDQTLRDFMYSYWFSLAIQPQLDRWLLSQLEALSHQLQADHYEHVYSQNDVSNLFLIIRSAYNYWLYFYYFYFDSMPSAHAAALTMAIGFVSTDHTNVTQPVIAQPNVIQSSVSKIMPQQQNATTQCPNFANDALYSKHLSAPVQGLPSQERRRIQNRAASRKYRLKKKLRRN